MPKPEKVANDTERFYPGEKELKERVLQEVATIDLTLPEPMLKDAFKLRMEQLKNDPANEEIIEMLAQVHKVLESDRENADRREELRQAALIVDSLQS